MWERLSRWASARARDGDADPISADDRRIACGRTFCAAHVVNTDQLPAQFRQALTDTFPGSGEGTMPSDPANWMIITRRHGRGPLIRPWGARPGPRISMAWTLRKPAPRRWPATRRSSAWAAESSFCPTAGLSASFRARNPEFVVAVLWEHGDWGSNAAKLAAQVATVYVNKKRMQDHNAGRGRQPKPNQSRWGRSGQNLYEVGGLQWNHAGCPTARRAFSSRLSLR